MTVRAIPAVKLKDGDMLTVPFRDSIAVSSVKVGNVYVSFRTEYGPTRVGKSDEVLIEVGEKQYLVCANCGEAFDNIPAAHEHGFSDLSGTAGWCGDDGFSILPESEAL